jgi:hypothetical protein
MDMSPDSKELNLFGVTEGTDKTFLVNDYLTHYSRLFEAMKHDDINILEIGVWNGASLRTWRNYFTRATIIGIDIQEQCYQYQGDRVKIEIGSQADEIFLKKVGEEFKPTIIIDDGSHVSDHQIVSLETLFPLMMPGGIYVIEDLFFQVNPETADSCRGTGPILAIDYLLACARDRSSWVLEDPTAERRRRLILSYLNRLEFFGGSAVLHKHKNIATPLEIAELSEVTLKDTFLPLAWHRVYSHSIFWAERGGLEERVALMEIAARAARMAYRTDEITDSYHARISQMREIQRKLADDVLEARTRLEAAHGPAKYAELKAKIDGLLPATASPTAN